MLVTVGRLGDVEIYNDIQDFIDLANEFDDYEIYEGEGTGKFTRRQHERFRCTQVTTLEEAIAKYNMASSQDDTIDRYLIIEGEFSIKNIETEW